MKGNNLTQENISRLQAAESLIENKPILRSKKVVVGFDGFVDEIVSLTDLRKYIKAFTGANYQNPKSITPVHQMLLPRIIKG